jgi:hypothetical protein
MYLINVLLIHFLRNKMKDSFFNMFIAGHLLIEDEKSNNFFCVFLTSLLLYKYTFFYEYRDLFSCLQTDGFVKTQRETTAKK